LFYHHKNGFENLPRVTYLAVIRKRSNSNAAYQIIFNSVLMNHSKMFNKMWWQLTHVVTYLAIFMVYVLNKVQLLYIRQLDRTSTKRPVKCRFINSLLPRIFYICKLTSEIKISAKCITCLISFWQTDRGNIYLFFFKRLTETLLFSILINLLKTERRVLYLKAQSVPRCKRFSSRL
jgi:hypothetical protein